MIAPVHFHDKSENRKLHFCKLHQEIKTAVLVATVNEPERGLQVVIAGNLRLKLTLSRRTAMEPATTAQWIAMPRQ